MTTSPSNLPGSSPNPIEGLQELRQLDGPPSQFWLLFIALNARLLNASWGLLLLGHREGAPSWKVALTFPNPLPSGVDASPVESLASRALDKSQAASQAHAGGTLIGMPYSVEGDPTISVLILFLPVTDEARVAEARSRMELAATTPVDYNNARALRQAKHDLDHFASALDVMVILNAQSRYLAVAMAFCNELASRYHATRVSLGWRDGNYIRIQAISHIEKFERKMTVVQRLEAAMEETFDQDEEVLLPVPEGSLLVTRDHENFADLEQVSYVLSLPVRVNHQPAGVLLLEREEESFSNEDVRALRVLCDQAGRRLDDLKRTDCWFGKRWLQSLHRGLSSLWGYEHTWAKLAGICAAIVLAILVFGRWPYRVEAPFLIRTEALAHLPGPFDGYIEEVRVRIGDEVKQGDVLLRLDNREFLIEQAGAEADMRRYLSEAEKAESAKSLAEMRVAQALADQARARADLNRYRLDQAEIKAPFTGVVVEGDLRERVGAPVKTGEVLFKIARIEGMYAELKVPERDIHEIRADATGEIAFTSRPDLTFHFKLDRIEPAALADKDGNVFVVRCVFVDPPQAWWRPGMGGVAKLNVEKRAIIWIATHRAIDFLRLKLWL